MAHKFAAFAKTSKNLKKEGDRATFLTFLTPNFVPGFGKILGAVSEIIRDTQTDKRMDNTDFIGPFRFSTGHQKNKTAPPYLPPSHYKVKKYSN